MNDNMQQPCELPGQPAFNTCPIIFSHHLLQNGPVPYVRSRIVLCRTYFDGNWIAKAAIRQYGKILTEIVFAQS
jgi:hypothetical protein